MSKKFRIAVSDTVLVPVAGAFRDADGVEQPFSFSLICNRESVEEQKKSLGKPMADFVAERTIGWRDQKLVLDIDTGAPAEFCADALAALLNINGISPMAFQAYMVESGAIAKN